MGCLDENTVVELVEARLSGTRRRGAEDHLDDCPHCRQLVAHTAQALLPTSDGQPATAVDAVGALLPGAVVGRYRVQHLVGRGAMGAVYAAEHLELRRQVALKVVRSDSHRGGNDAQLRARLVREARAASAVRHPNVVTVHDVLELADGSPVLVMDLLEGESLRSRLDRQERLSVTEALQIADQVLAALEAAHGQGVIHRDLKPDNIFLCQQSQGEVVKIVDFGIAKLTAVEGPAAETVGLTETGMLVGTPHYMAPEQAFSDDEIDHRIDLWAVGVILYECLAGVQPIEGANVAQVLRALAQLAIVPLEQRAPHVPLPLVELITSLFNERQRRPDSAAALRSALSELETDPTGATVVRANDDEAAAAKVDSGAVGDSGAAVVLDGGQTPSMVERMKRWAVAPWGVIAVLVLLGAGLVGWYGRAASGPAGSQESAAGSTVPLEPSARSGPEPRPSSSSRPSSSPRAVLPPESAASSAVRPRAPAPAPPPSRVVPTTAKSLPTAQPSAEPTGPGKLITTPPF